MWILKKKYDIGETDLKRLTGRLKLHFLTEIGRFHWNQGAARSFLWQVGEHAEVGKETLKFGSIFGSLPDFPSLRP
jgi:hypothetical protein